jgi:hypothetical protein
MAQQNQGAAYYGKSISQFKGTLARGGVRPTMFQVDLTFPDGTTNDEADVIQKASMLCKGAAIPAGDIGVISVPFRGRQLKVAGDRTFAEWTVTVINDANFTVRKAMEKWSERIQNHNFALGETVLENYFQDLTVRQLDRDGLNLRTYKVFSAWPSAMSEIALDFGTENSIEEYQVTFQYQFWHSSDANDVGTSGRVSDENVPNLDDLAKVTS